MKRALTGTDPCVFHTQVERIPCVSTRAPFVRPRSRLLVSCGPWPQHKGGHELSCRRTQEGALAPHQTYKCRWLQMALCVNTRAPDTTRECIHTIRCTAAPLVLAHQCASTLTLVRGAPCMFEKSLFTNFTSARMPGSWRCKHHA